MSPNAAKLDRGMTGPVASALLIIISAYCLYEMRIRLESVSFQKRMEDILEARRFPQAPDLLIRQDYTGLASVDYGLGLLAAVFLPSMAGFKTEYLILQAYFLVSFLPLLLIFAVEAGRRGMKYGWTYFTSIWALLYQTVAGAGILPLYFLCFMWDNAKLQRIAPSERQLSLSYAKALLPAILIGYLVPTIAMYTPFPDPGLHIHQGVVAFWQFSPLIVNLLLFVTERIFAFITASPRKGISVGSRHQDISYVSTLYLICILVSVTAHFAMLYTCAIQPGGFWNMLREVFSFRPDRFYSPVEGDVLHHVFQVDFFGICSAAFVWSYIVVYDTNILGLADVNMASFTIVLLLGSLVVGPATAISCVWLWREDKIRKEDKAKAM